MSALVGSTLMLSADAMDYHKRESLPMISSVSACRMRATMRLPRRPDYGATASSPSSSFLIVDGFGVVYVRKKDADHLAKTLKKHHTISQDWEGKKLSGIDLTWTYDPNPTDRTCRL